MSALVHLDRRQLIMALAQKRSIVIDCDPGIDDAIALLLAIGSTSFDIRAITTVAGNVPLAKTQANARRICELAKHPDLQVYAGCPRPLLQSLTCAAHVHGDNGLAGVVLPEPTMPLQSQHGVDAIITILTAPPEPIVLATLAPLTNIAIAMVKAPQICQNIAEIVIMGGSAGRGNVTPSAEFNFFVDPHAAQIVVSSGVPITLISLDLTHQALATPERQAKIQALNNPISKIVLEMLPQYSNTDRANLDILAPPLHDPCVIAYLLQPELFELQPASVAIETASPLTLGRSIIELKRSRHHPFNVKFATKIDSDGFYQLLTETFGKF